MVIISKPLVLFTSKLAYTLFSSENCKHSGRSCLRNRVFFQIEILQESYSLLTILHLKNEFNNNNLKCNAFPLLNFRAPVR